MKGSRRSFLRIAGAAVGGIALGAGGFASWPTPDRYVIDTRTASVESLDAEVVHRLDGIDIAIVSGPEPDADGALYATDTTFSFEGSVGGVTQRAVAQDATEAEGGLPDGAARTDYQWDKLNQGAFAAHRYADGSGTRIAVIDSGVLDAHPDLAGAVDAANSRNLVDDGAAVGPTAATGDHGTHVAGVIAGRNAGGDGIAGTASGAEIVSLKVFDESGAARFGDIVAAIYASADLGCDVANVSLGRYPLPLDDRDVRWLRDALSRATSYAAERGTLVVAAAGNDGANLDGDGDVITLPGEAANVLNVGATGPVGFAWSAGGSGLAEPASTPADYTNYGAEAIDLSAPGGAYDPNSSSGRPYDAVFSAGFEVVDGEFEPTYAWKAGTSMAAPQVSGAAALVRQRHPDATVAELRDHLLATATSLDPTYHGEGHVDTLAAARTDLDR